MNNYELVVIPTIARKSSPIKLFKKGLNDANGIVYTIIFALGIRGTVALAMSNLKLNLDRFSTAQSLLPSYKKAYNDL
jgi:hypothetical protein